MAHGVFGSFGYEITHYCQCYLELLLKYKFVYM